MTHSVQQTQNQLVLYNFHSVSQDSLRADKRWLRDCKKRDRKVDYRQLDLFIFFDVPLILVTWELLGSLATLGLTLCLTSILSRDICNRKRRITSRHCFIWTISQASKIGKHQTNMWVVRDSSKRPQKGPVMQKKPNNVLGLTQAFITLESL